MIVKGYLFSVIYALICLALAFVLYKVGVAKKITRKLVHILVGFEWVILYYFHGPGVHFLAVCVLFLVILAVSHRKKLMPMISSDGDNSPGTVYYALAMSIMAAITLFVPDMILPFGIGVFCTSLGDGFAGLLGQWIRSTKNVKIYGNKTVCGTLVNVFTCAAAAGVMNCWFGLGMQPWHIVAIALFATELELITGRGLDNVTVTLGVSFISYLFINFSDSINYIIPIILTPLIIAFAYKKRALTVSGIIAAVFVDIIISASLGNFGFLILFSFFACGTAVDKIKKRHIKIRQKDKLRIEKRGDCRDHVQVLANSFVSVICAVLYFITRKELFVVAFVASLAEALADTAASGIGVLSGRAYDIFRGRQCQPGASGGMSLFGTLSSLIGAAVIALITFAFGRIGALDMLVIVFAAFLGAIFDSFLGSVLQVKYKCNVCGNIVEREEHCGARTVKHSGLKFVNNDTVNLFGTLFAAFLAAIMYVLI